MESCDVVIVGAGPAGSTTAKLLAEAGLKVILVEKSEFDKPRIGESLSPGINPLLQELELWDQFLKLNPLPSYGTRSVWGSANPEMHAHLFGVYGNGWHVNRLAMDIMLGEAAEKEGVKLYTGCWLLGLTYEEVDQNFNLRIRHKNSDYCINTKFLVDASGRKAVLSPHFTTKKIVFDRLIGIAVKFEDEQACNRLYTMVETTKDGWWYSAPLSSNTSMATLMTDGDIAVKNNFNHLTGWMQALMGSVLTAANFINKKPEWGPFIFPSVTQRVVRHSTDNRPFLSVGDASLSVDPISGSGVIRALRTAREGANAIITAFSGNTDAITQYDCNRNEDCHKYLLEWANYYGIEQRWPHDGFWKRRALIQQTYCA
jgi:flavin-dependent dehydrogenase